MADMIRATKALAAMHKRWGDKVASIGADIAKPERIASGVFEFDIATGGGWPEGRMSIVYGGKDTGKSLLLYVTIATYLEQHPDRKAALLDLEGNYDSEWGRAIGIDEDRVVFLMPDYGEMAVDMIFYLVENVEDVGLICIDSLAQLMPCEELRKSAEDAIVGTTGLMIARLCRRSCTSLNTARKNDHKVTLIYANQTRCNIGVRMGNPITQPGGKSPQFYASMVVATYNGKEEIDADVNATTPCRKRVVGVVEKKKGPIVAKKFEYDAALIAHRGVVVGRSVGDWKMAAAYLAQMGQFGKSADGKGWEILGGRFRLKAECRAWYEQNRTEVKALIIEHLMGCPGDV